MGRIIRGQQRVGTVGAKQISNLSGHSRAAALVGSGAGALQAAIDEMANFAIAQAQEKKALQDGEFTSDVDNKNTMFMAQNQDRFENDAGAYYEESFARDAETLKASSEILSPKSQALMKMGMEKARIKNFVKFSEKQLDNERKTAIHVTNTNLNNKYEEFTNEARDFGTAGIPSLLEDLVLTDAQIYEFATRGGLADVTYTNGDTALDRVVNTMQAMKTDMVGAAIATDAEAILNDPKGGQDAAFQYVAAFARDGKIVVNGEQVDTSDLSPKEREKVANYAYQAVRHTLNGTAEARRAASDAVLEAEAKQKADENNRQFEVTANWVTDLRKSGGTMTVADIMALGAAERLEASHMASIFSAVQANMASNEGAGDAVVMGKLLDFIDKNPGKYTAGSVEALIATAAPEISKNPGQITQVFAKIGEQQRQMGAKLARMQSAASRMSRNMSLDWGSKDDKLFVAEAEKNGLTAADGTVLMDPINYNGDAPAMEAQRDNIVMFVRSTGIVSDGLKGFWRSAMNDTQNTDLVREGTMLYMAIQDKLPIQLQEQIPSSVSAFYGQVAERFGEGAYPAEAVEEVRRRVQNPTGEERNRKLTEITGSDDPDKWIRENLDEALEELDGFLADYITGIPDITDAMVAKARDVLIREGQRYTDAAVAMKAVVAPTIATMFKPTRFGPNGRETYEHRPIESYYGDANDDVDYVSFQVADFAEAFFKRTMGEVGGPLSREEWIDNGGEQAPKHWWLQLDPRTRTEANPAYTVHYMDEDGLIHDIGLGPVKQGFRPNPAKSIDVLKERDMAKSFDRALMGARRAGNEAEVSAFIKVIDILPGGKKAFLASEKAASDTIDWLRRGDIAQAKRSLANYVDMEKAKIFGQSSIWADIAGAVGLGGGRK